MDESADSWQTLNSLFYRNRKRETVGGIMI